MFWWYWQNHHDFPLSYMLEYSDKSPFWAPLITGFNKVYRKSRILKERKFNEYPKSESNSPILCESYCRIWNTQSKLSGMQITPHRWYITRPFPIYIQKRVCPFLRSKTVLSLLRWNRFQFWQTNSAKFKEVDS